MKRMAAFLLTLLLLAVLLTGCAKAAGGSYTLDRVSTEGRRIRPGDLGMSVSFTLESDGTGSGIYNGISRKITWAEDDSTVTVNGLNGTLVFTKNGKDLLLHDNGTILTFTLEEEED